MDYETAKAILKERLGSLVFGEEYLNHILRTEIEDGYDPSAMDREAWEKHIDENVIESVRRSVEEARSGYPPYPYRQH